MKVIVLGGGVIGVTSAWYLAKAGHDVTVIDRQMGVGRETSFANAGEISPGYASPWAGPGIPVKALKWLLMRHPPLILNGPFDFQMLRWLAAMLRNCTEARYSINKSRMVRLAEFSRDRLIALRAETSIAYDQRMQGTLQLFRTQKQIDGVEKDLAVLRAGGVPFEQLDREGCITAEPGLAAARDRVIGGLRLPNDETGDCFKFTEALASLATGCGVTFQLQTTIQRLEHMSDSIVGVHTDQGIFRGDAYLVALGSASPQLLQPLGMSLPIYPVKGYSITLPVKRGDVAPVSTIMDETYKIAITRLGSRIRVGGMAELSGFDTTLPDRRRQALLHSLTDLFPGAAEPNDAVFWSGLRPMTPDGTPIIGVTAYSNLFLNTGHGTLGWTMACGSGHIIADIVSGIVPAIATRDLAIARYAAS